MKRRAFVIKGGLGSMALVTSTSLWGSSSFFSAGDTINLGVIGTGSRGRGMIPLIEGVENLNVAACCDTLPFRLQEGLLASSGKVKGYSNYKKLLDNKDIDAVFIATPFNTHSKIAIDALDAGKHVYSEKTLAKGYAGISDLFEKAQSSKQIFQTGHQYHSSHLYKHVVEMIQSGKVGKVVAIDCQWNRNGNWRKPVNNPSLEKEINWRMYREYSGGLVAELSSHQIDFVNWVLKATPETVVGVGGIDYWKDGRETYDNIHLIYNYPNGIKAKFTCLTSNAKDDYQIKVFGDKGTIMLDYLQAWFYPEGDFNKEIGNVDGVSGATIPWDQGKGMPIEIIHSDPSLQAILDFKESIMSNKEPLSNVESGAKTAVCVQMGLDAMDSNKMVRWDPGFII